MSRPLIISDCDEVLLHMVVPFKMWLDESKDIDFSLENADFVNALTHRKDGTTVPTEAIWGLLGEFFDSEMPRQNAIAGAIESLNALSERADVVILTNLMDERQEARTAQLAQAGLHARVYCNQGPKGPALSKIINEHNPSMAIFIDDLPNHHESVHGITPDIWRLHMVGEPILAPHIKPAPFAHERIDIWADAKIWIDEVLDSGANAPAL